MVAGCAMLAGGGGRSGTPLSGPGAASLEAWYRWNMQQEFAPLLYSTDVSAVAVSVTWPTFTAMALRLRVKAGGTGTRATSVLEWSADGGGSWTTIGPGLGSTVNLTGGVVLNLPTGTYTAGQLWVSIVSSFRDNKNAHHWVSQDTVPTLLKNPQPKATPYGTFLGFDGVAHMMRCQDTLAATVAGGTAKPFYVCAVLYLDSVAPSSGQGTIFWMGDGVTLNGILAGAFATGPAWRAFRADDTAATASRNGGLPVIATPYVWEYAYDGSLVTVTVNGALAINAQALAPGGNALAGLTVATLGKSFLAGAEGNPLAFSIGELSLYKALPAAGDRAIIRNRMRAGFGF